MGRLNFGGAQDLSGVFASLQQRYENKVEADVANAKARAMKEQAAEDKEVYAQWKAGKISDAAWLSHLGGRRDAALEPEERAEYAELFLEHEGAISDAQVEANFALGRVSLGALMKHYTTRMGGVEENSPAWRDMASRYGQLSQAAQAGAGSGGGGGGSRRSGGRGGGGSRGGSGSGSSKDYNPQAVVDAADAASAGQMFKGIHTGGADLVDPTSAMVPIEDDDDLINALLSDIDRIKALEVWMSEHPSDRTVIDEMTGETFEVTSDFLLEIDKQYLRTEQALAAAYMARGGAENVKKGNTALGHATAWVAGAMTRHATIKAEPLLRQLEQHVFTELVGASEEASPADRRQIYSRALRTVEAWSAAQLEGGRGREIPDAMRPDDEIFARTQNLRDLLSLGVNGRNMSSEEFDDLANKIMTADTGLGEGGASISFRTLIEGPGDNGSDDVPDGFVGLLENMDQEIGLEASSRMETGTLDPDYDGDFYVYQYDGKRTKPVIADVRDQANVKGGVSSVLVPQDAELESVVMTRVRMGGKAQTVWVELQPVDDPRFRVYRNSDGSLLTSAEIADMGAPRLRALVSRGEVEVDSVLTAVKMPDGNVWFYDSNTGMLGLKAPITVTRDPVTNGVQVDKNKKGEGEAVVNHIPHWKGVMTPFAGIRTFEMQQWTNNATAAGIVNPSNYRERDAGGSLIDLSVNLDAPGNRDSIEFMYEPEPKKGPRPINPRIQDNLRARSRSSEEEFEKSVAYARMLGAPTTKAGVDKRMASLRDRAEQSMGIKVGGAQLPQPMGGVFSEGLSAGGVRMPVASGGAAGFIAGALRNLFGPDPREDAQVAMQARSGGASGSFTFKPAPPKRIAAPVEEISYAPPPVTRAPLPLLRTQPIDVALPSRPAPVVRRPTTDTPALIRTRTPSSRNPEAL